MRNFKLQKNAHVLNLFSESETVNEIIFAETGFDMTKVHKGDLHRETQDEALSVICFTPEPEVVQEETVPKSQYKQLVQSHRDEIQMLQDQYELVLRLLHTFKCCLMLCGYVYAAEIA